MDTRNITNSKAAIAFAGFLLWMLLFISFAPSYAAGQDDPYRVEEFTLNGPGHLEVRTSGGHISAKASETNQVRVEMYVTKDGRELSPSDTDLDNFDIEISQSGNNITAIAKRENGGWSFWNNGNNISISFVVYTPQEMSTELKTSGGHIEARGLSGNQQIATSGGHLELAGLQGTVDAKTSGGHIAITDFKGKMDARTSGGHIEVSNAEGQIHVRTSGGHIDLAHVSGTIDASTSGGSISADLVSIGQSINLETSGGSIHISVPEGTGLDLDLEGSSVRTELKNFSGNVERDEIEGEINGGGPTLAAHTSGGTVSISFRP